MRFPSTLFLCLAALAADAAPPLPRLKVSDDRRTLVTQAGAPFFYLGDTAWELFHHLTREDAELYLHDRAGKGFNVIQAVVLAEFGGLTEPNSYGHLPLRDNDPAQPVEEYFQHVDWVVQKAAELGIYVGMLPTWGDKVNKKWGQGPEIFTPDNARIFGEFLGRRYRDQPIIWILGGDRPIEQEQHRLIYRSLAEGLRAGDGGAHLMSYHPNGGRSSAEYVQDETWLDFHMIQSGHHGRDNRSYTMIASDLSRTPPRPVLDAEPNYEDHPVRGSKSKDDWFDDWDARKETYWSVFAGGCGVTYGCHPIWQFWDGKSKKLTDPRHSWKEDLSLPGSIQVGHLRRLIESRTPLTRLPDQSLIVTPNPDGPEHAQVIRDRDGTWVMIYSASGKELGLKTSALSTKHLRAWWFDPRTGEAAPAPGLDWSPLIIVSPPTHGEKCDWVLVIEDADKFTLPPGQTE